MEQQVQVTVENGIKELILREGTAPKVFDPVKVIIKGTISAPRIFLSKRKLQVPLDKSYAIVDKTKGEIKLVIDEKDPHGTTVEGSMVVNPELVAFSINTPKVFSLKEIQQFLRMRRAHFSSKDENEKILKKLSEFSAKLEIEIKSQNDRRGNSIDSVQAKLTHEIPLYFILNMEVYKGYGKKKFSVDIFTEVTDQSIKFWMESVEMEELLKNERDSILEEELKALDEYVVIEV
jgi:hypothetical protein